MNIGGTRFATSHKPLDKRELDKRTSFFDVIVSERIEEYVRYKLFLIYSKLKRTLLKR